MQTFEQLCWWVAAGNLPRLLQKASSNKQRESVFKRLINGNIITLVSPLLDPSLMPISGNIQHLDLIYVKSSLLLI